MSELATTPTRPAPRGPGPRPYYELSVLSSDVTSEVRVNDVPALRLPSGRVETTFDVNPYVITGMNMLSLSVRAARGKTAMGRGASCTVKLGVRSAPGAADLTPVAALIFRAPVGAPAGFEESPGFTMATPPFVRLAGLTATQPFQLDTPFLPWSWMSAPQIDATEAVRAEVLAEYRHIWGLLRARDVPALVRACREQARDYQDAYGLPDLDAANRMLGIARTLGDPDVAVEDFPEEALALELLGDRRLVQLVDAEGKSPLRLRVTSVEDMVGRFNVVLCRDGARWVIAR